MKSLCMNAPGKRQKQTKTSVDPTDRTRALKRLVDKEKTGLYTTYWLANAYGIAKFFVKNVWA